MEKREERVCLVCGSGRVEDERHFLLELREKLFDDMYMITEGRYNMRLMVDNVEWMVDALIGWVK